MVKLYGKGISMLTIEKTTFNLPTELKEKVSELKDELHMSMSSIYVEAIKQYVENQEEKKWQKAAELASKDEKYMKFTEDLDQVQDDIYEY